MEEIINKKLEEIYKNIHSEDRFIKIINFEGNAIGQIGERFVKQIFDEFNIPRKNEGKVIHDEYDIMSGDYKIEIKTARKGITNNTYQYNGFNPNYNYDYIIFIGLTTTNIYYQVINAKKSYAYDHHSRKKYYTINGKKKTMTAMNPGGNVNYKVTLNQADLKNIDNFVDELKNLFLPKNSL